MKLLVLALSIAASLSSTCEDINGDGTTSDPVVCTTSSHYDSRATADADCASDPCDANDANCCTPKTCSDTDGNAANGNTAATCTDGFIATADLTKACDDTTCANGAHCCTAKTCDAVDAAGTDATCTGGYILAAHLANTCTACDNEVGVCCTLSTCAVPTEGGAAVTCEATTHYANTGTTTCGTACTADTEPCCTADT